MKTEREIGTIVNVLYKERSTISQFSAFGDDNWQIIDAQIEALEWVLELVDTFDEYLEEEK